MRACVCGVCVCVVCMCVLMCVCVGGGGGGGGEATAYTFCIHIYRSIVVWEISVFNNFGMLKLKKIKKFVACQYLGLSTTNSHDLHFNSLVFVTFLCSTATDLLRDLAVCSSNRS